MRAGWVTFLHAVLFLVFVAQLLAFFGIGGEDCYITFRYARNLAEGRGLVYNPGEYVEGISNPYWALCLAGLYRLGPSMTFACSLLVFVHAAAAYAVTAAASAAWFGRRSWFSLLAPLLLCAMTTLHAGYQNGLEGSAAALGVSLVCLGVVGGRGGVLVAGVAVLLGNRPEAPGYAALSVLWFAARALRAEGRARRTELLWAAAVVALVAGMVLVRYGYYGDIVPHTLRAKGSVPFTDALPGGLRYLGAYAWAIGPWMLPIAAVAAADRVRKGEAAFLFLFVLLNAVVVLRNGGDWMANFRLLTPLFGAFALLAAAGFARCWQVPSPVFRAVAAGLFLAGAARMPDLRTLQISVFHWQDRVEAVLATPDKGNYHVENHVTGPVMGQEADDLLISENGGRLPYLLKEVRTVEMAGLTDRELVTDCHPCRDRIPGIGVHNWHGMFMVRKPTYLQFPQPKMGERLSRLIDCPEVAPSLDVFIVAQNTFSLQEIGHFDLLAVRNDRASLEQFIRDFGAFVPAADMARGIHGARPSPDSWHDITVGPWRLEAWKDARTGEPLAESWRNWFGRERQGAEISLSPGKSRFSKPLSDGCPLLVVVDLLPGAPQDTRLTFTRAGGAGSWSVPPEGRSFPADEYRCHYLFLPESLPGTAGELLLDAETSADCLIRISVSRWVSGPPPALPEAHLYPDKSDCRGMIARRTYLDEALDRMTFLYLRENDLEGLLGEWDTMDASVFPQSLRHYARGLAFEKSGRPSDALGEYGFVTEKASVAWWRRVPEAVRKMLRLNPALARSLPHKAYLKMALLGRARVLAVLGDAAGAETACLEAVEASGGDYAAYEALDALYTGRVSPGEAAQKWGAVAAAHPDHAWARYMLSLARSRTARHEEALHEARAALALSPDNQMMQAHVMATVRKAAAEHLSRGRFAEALSLWREVGGVDGKLGAAKTLAALGDAQGAETAFLEAVEASGGDYAAYEALDALYTRRISAGEALQKWGAVATAHPDHAWARYMLSLAYLRIARHEEALQEARAALALSPDNQVMRAHVLAMVREVAAEHLSRGRSAEALSLWREVGGVDGKLGEAKALEALGDVAGAEKAYLSVLLTEPEARVLDAYAGLDALYAAALPPAERPARWLEVARKVPDQPWAHIYRGCALEALSQGDKAQEAYLQAAATLIGAHLRGN
ncbi:MAG TPA: hypothetical protein PKL54_07730 [Candidatus Hydrogenedentes bacterium]|nr:hypothetical protein [Candidatus Hydrogenedentota bacterium]